VIRREHLTTLAQWVGLGASVGVICGAASALFLWLLQHATDFRLQHEQIVWALPVAGLALGWLYERFGAPIKGGSDLIIDTLHDDRPTLPLRMAPMVMVGTVLTHLFGGSAGREGTAVQMGASLADALALRLKLSGPLRRQLIIAGVAGGFGSVFGTPIAGAIFALEFITLGKLEYQALLPALVAAVAGALTTHALGIEHTLYLQATYVELTPRVIGKWILFAGAVALVTATFIELTHFLKRQGERRVGRLPFRMMIGGAVIVLLWQLLGTGDYLGLGISGIQRSFTDPLPSWAFAAKLLFTAVTLGAGFLGGEVTPLFFVGASLGSVLARLLGLPIELGAGVGLAAVFAAASNTPLALSIMAMELLGASVFPHAVIVCVLAYLFTGHRSIYPAQRVTRGKGGGLLSVPTALRDLRTKPKR
jgi:H+/Cl- antiporter ClcA